MMLKNKKGITLIALVITIIVLLILAGISISMISAEDGVLIKAKDSKQSSEQTTDEEKVRLAVQSALIAGEGNVDLTGDVSKEGSLKNELLKNGLVENKDYKSDEDGTLTLLKHDNLQLKITAKGSVDEGDKTKTYAVGDEVAVKGEKFYVIKDNGETVTLLAKYCLNEAGTAQSSTRVTCKFSNSNYWSNYKGSYPLNLNENYQDKITDGTAIAISRARTYSQTITGNSENGRLMTHEEVKTLCGMSTDHTTVGPMSELSFINAQEFWLGTAVRSDSVWGLDGSYYQCTWRNDDYAWDDTFGVRPIIEASKTLIQ